MRKKLNKFLLLDLIKKAGKPFWTRFFMKSCPICGGTGIYLSEDRARDPYYSITPADRCGSCSGTGRVSLKY